VLTGPGRATPALVQVRTFLGSASIELTLQPEYPRAVVEGHGRVCGLGADTPSS